MIKGEHGWQTLLAQEVHHRLQCSFSVEIRMSLRAEEDGSPGIDEVEHFHHVLALAVGIGGDRGGVECASICTSSRGSRSSNGFRLRSGASRM